MHFTKKVAAPIALAGLVAAAPTIKEESLVARANGGSSYSDATILNYALTLEHLERAFYREGLNMYNAGAFNNAKFPSWVRERFTEIASHEKTHVDFLTTALTAAGATPVKECKYAFGVTGPESFLATSQILEGVGVAAYLGAAPAIQNKAYLSVAGSILIVEAQHEAWVRSAADTEDAFPRAFAAGLDFNQVYSLAAPFITSCPANNPTLPFKTFPALTAKVEGTAKSGACVKFSTKATGAKYAAFVSATSTVYQEISGSSGSVKIPADITGQSYLILTNSKSVTDSATVAGPAIVYVDVPASNMNYQ